MSPTRVIVFAKAPKPGSVKTRLIPVLGPAGAAELARRMLHLTLQTARGARLGPVELCMSPGPGSADWFGVPLPEDVELTDQGAGDLGERMSRAARRAIGLGWRVILLGTDCPEISIGLMHQAEAALRETGAVIHCTVDGGYALLGLSRYSDELFQDVPWGGAKVAATTFRRFSALDWPLSIGRTLHDVDEPADLPRLPPGWISALVPRPRKEVETG